MRLKLKQTYCPTSHKTMQYMKKHESQDDSSLLDKLSSHCQWYSAMYVGRRQRLPLSRRELLPWMELQLCNWTPFRRYYPYWSRTQYSKPEIILILVHLKRNFLIWVFLTSPNLHVSLEITARAIDEKKIAINSHIIKKE